MWAIELVHIFYIKRRNKMKKLNKIILGAATASTAIVPIAAIVSCGDSNIGDVWAYSHRDVHMYEQSHDGNSPFYGTDYRFIPEAQYHDTGSIGDTFTTGTIINFFRRDKVGRDTFTKAKTVENGHKVTKILSNPNRATKLSFEAIGSVTITTKDASGTKTTTTFDDDSIGLGNPKSINSPTFKATLDGGGITAISFKLNDKMKDSYWIQNKTGKKKSKITMEDVRTSLQYDFYKNVKYFGEHITGSLKTDKNKRDILFNYYNTKSRVKTPVFQDAKAKDTDHTLLRYENINGLFKDQFNKPNLIKDDTLTLRFNEQMSIKQQKHKILSFWNDLFVHAGGLGLRSTQNIKDLIKKHPIPKSLTDQLFDTEAELKKFKDSALYKSGVLSSYLTHWDEFEVGGKYYFTTNEAKKLAVTINPYYNAYIGKEKSQTKFSSSTGSDAVKWGEQKNSKGDIVVVRSLTKHYLTESPLSEHIKLQAYKQGFNAIYKEPKDLSKDEYVESLANPGKYGIRFATGFTSGAVIGDYNFWQILPLYGRATPGAASGKDKLKENVYFNDAYSKVMWGHTIKELSERHDTQGDAMISAIAGHGFQFRQTIMASLNTFGLLKEEMGHVNDWSSQFAPELQIHGPGSDIFLPAHADAFATAHPAGIASTPEGKLLLQGITSKYIVSIDSTGKISATQITWDDYKKQYTKADGEAIDKVSAPKAKFDELKKSMKSALDKAGIAAGQKVSFEIPFGRHPLASKKLRQKIDSMITIINSLDPRLRAAAEMLPDGEGSATVVADKTTDSTFTITKNAKQTPFLKRLREANKGYSMASLSLNGKYATPTTSSAMFDHIGYLQNGILLATSYFSSTAGHTATSGGIMEPFGLIADKMKNSFNKYVQDNAHNVLDGKTGITNAVIDEIMNTKFEDIIKSHSQDLADFDYNGMLGPKDKESIMIKNLRTDAIGTGTHANAAGNQVTWKSVYKPVMDFISTWVDNVKYESDIYLSGLTLEEQLKIYRAFRLVEPGYMQKGPLGDRSVPAMSLSKNWLSMASDEYTSSFLSYWRVDEERG